jgi:hypothetical protein
MAPIRLAQEASPCLGGEKLHPFLITIGARDNPRLSFACMAADSFSAHQQHVDLAEPGEAVRVVPVGSVEPFPVRAAKQELACAELRTAISEAEAMLAESEAAAILAAYDAMTAADKAREFHRNNDRRAMAAQLQMPGWAL